MAVLPSSPRRIARAEPRTALQVCALLSIAGTLVAVGWTTFREELSRARTTEAVDRLAILYRSSATYWELALERSEGAVVARTFPPSAPLTPSRVPPGQRLADPPDSWNQPTWRTLGFSLSEPHFFAYEYRSDGVESAAGFTARALGDLDGNGIYSTYERAGRIGAAGEVEGPDGLWVDRPLE